MKISKFMIFILTLLLSLSLPFLSVLAASPQPSGTSPSPQPSTAASPQTSVSPQLDSPQPSASGSPESGFEIIGLSDGMIRTGASVIRTQMRLADLGYLCYRATGQFGQMSREAVIKFQVDNGLESDGSVGEETFNKLFENGLPRVKIAEDLSNTSGPALAGTPAKYGKAADWSNEILPLLTAGDTIKITDFNSNETFNMKFLGGSNHAEVEPSTDVDNQKFLKAFGGRRNFEKRSVLVTIESTDYAASLFGWQHGDNERQTCLYFSGSLSHVFNLPDVEHEKWIKIAAGS